jgi:hypothetical protein
VQLTPESLEGRRRSSLGGAVRSVDMRYRVHGFTVRSENAAKSPGEASGGLVAWIRANVRVRTCLDYGCGRLRYAEHLAHRAERLALVDSEEQLNRLIDTPSGPSTIGALGRRRWSHSRVYTTKEFWRGLPTRYDFVLCANVLSAIPSKNVRTRSLRAIQRCLSSDGQVLVVNQHTNSYFTAARNHAHAVPHLDGWLIPSRRGAAYYGVLKRDKVIRILRGHRFRIIDAWIEGQSNLVLARAR